MFEIKIHNIYNGKEAFEKELAIKKTLRRSPKKMIIQIKKGVSFTVFPTDGNMDSIKTSSYWNYTDILNTNILFIDSVDYYIRFRIGPMHINELGDLVTSQKKLEEKLAQLFQIRRVKIILDYSSDKYCKKIHMAGRFQEIEIYPYDCETEIMTKLKFSTNEKDIKIEQKSLEEEHSSGDKHV